MSAAHPVASGVTILSGQLITKNWNGTTDQYEWVLGNAGQSVPHFALNDSTDEDVIEAGVLPALSCLGQFELQIAFFTTGGGNVYNDGTLLTPDGTTGNVKSTTAGSGLVVCGVVSKIHGPEDISAINSNVLKSGQTTVVQFVTNYQLNPA